MNSSSPYRIPPEVVSLWKPRTISGRLRHLKRRMTIAYCGRHRNRYCRCKECNKAVNFDKKSRDIHVMLAHPLKYAPDQLNMCFDFSEISSSERLSFYRRIFRDISLKDKVRYYFVLLTDEIVNHFANNSPWL